MTKPSSAVALAALLAWSVAACGKTEISAATGMRLCRDAGAPAGNYPPPPGFVMDVPKNGTDVDLCYAAVTKVDRRDPVCIPPKGVTMGQMVDVFVKYVDARSHRGHERFSVLAHEALVAAWPCRR
jgi:Rap1a immunity proteins